MSAKKIVFIDWYRTLSNSRMWGHLAQRPTLEKVCFVDLSKDATKWMRGEISTARMSELIGTRTCLSPRWIRQELIASVSNMSLVSPEIPALVNNLRKSGKEVYIASDNMETFREYTIPSMKLDEHFDGFLISNELGRLKMDFAGERILFFEEFLKQKGIKPTEAILLDDNIDTSGNYQKAGFEIHQIQQPADLITALKELAELA